MMTPIVSICRFRLGHPNIILYANNVKVVIT